MVGGENPGLRLLMTALHVHRLWDTEKNNNHNLLEEAPVTCGFLGGPHIRIIGLCEN